MKIIGIAFVVLSVVAGCKPGSGPQSPQPQPPPSQPQQQRKACTQDTNCAIGFHCTSGVCASAAPTAAAYDACSLDVDCPVGDHCDLGACAHDCVADRDCATGKTCDMRGRCAAPA